MNKKGQAGGLTGEVLELVAAVIVVGLLIFGAWKVYQVIINQPEKDAQKTIDSVMAKLVEIEGNGNIIIQGIKDAEYDWFLEGFGISNKGQSRPDKCFFESCLCICAGSKDWGGYTIDPNVMAGICQKKGFCRGVGEESRYLDVGTSRTFVRGDHSLDVDLQYIDLSKPKLVDLSVFKRGDTLKIHPPHEEHVGHIGNIQ